jgi:uncharacterized protein (TIRG00374 family)
MNQKRLFRVALGFAITGGFIWLIAKKTDFTGFLSYLSEVKIAWLLLALAVYVFEYVIRISRWRLMLSDRNANVTWSDCSAPLLLGYAINVVLPFRAGDIIRSFAFKERLGVGAGVVIATVFVERVLDLMVVLAVLGITLLIFDNLSLPLLRTSTLSIFLICAVLLVILFIPHVLYPVFIVFRKVLTELPAKASSRLIKGLDYGFASLKSLGSLRKMGLLVSYSTAIWALEVIVFFLCAVALPSFEHLEASFLAMPLGTLATLIPSTPGYVGTFDFFVSYAGEVFGNSSSASVAYALIVHSILLIPLVFVALAHIFWNPKGTRRSLPATNKRRM